MPKLSWQTTKTSDGYLKPPPLGEETLARIRRRLLRKKLDAEQEFEAFERMIRDEKKNKSF